MPYDEGQWRILSVDPAESLGAPILDAAADGPRAITRVAPAYLLAHVPALSPDRHGICLGWAADPRWEWALQCPHAPGGCESAVTGEGLRLWNHRAQDFLVFDAGEFGPALRWLTDYQRLQRMSVGAREEAPRLPAAAS